MLVLSRHLNEKILLPTINTSIQIVSIKGGVVRLGIQAPAQVEVFREEIFDQAAWETKQKEKQLHDELELERNTHRARNHLNASTLGVALMRRQLKLGLNTEASHTLEQVNRELQHLRDQIEEGANASSSRTIQNRCRALLVEDDSNERELLAGFLRLSGMEVDTAGDGCDALDHLKIGPRPDVVLLDMNMPRCDGPTTLREIRQNPALKELTIFAVTGMSPERLGVNEGPGGVDGWFTKPLNPEHLLCALQRRFEARS